MTDESAKLLPGLSAVEEAEHRAYRRGQEAAELKGELQHHFSEDDRRFGELKGEQQQTTQTLQTVVVKVDDLGKKVDTASAVTVAKAEDAKKRAEEAKEVAASQISARQFFVGLASVFVGILAVAAAVLGALAASGNL